MDEVKQRVDSSEYPISVLERRKGKMVRMKALSLVFGCCVLMLTATAFGQATMYTVPDEVTASAGDIIEFEIWTDNSNGETVRAWQTWFDCFGPLAPTMPRVPVVAPSIT
jgi:hypothetical protein